MSKKSSFKIKSSHLGILATTLFLVGVITANGKLIIENIVRSGGVDEEAILEAVPRLNKKQLEEAVKILNSIQDKNLTSNFSSDTFNTEATLPGEQRIITLNVQNASGVNGAAAQVAQAAQEEGYEIYEISTALSLQNTTTVVYQQGLAQPARAVEEFLKTQGWSLGQSLEANQEQPYDIIIILGN